MRCMSHVCIRLRTSTGGGPPGWHRRRVSVLAEAVRGRRWRRRSQSAAGHGRVGDSGQGEAARSQGGGSQAPHPRRTRSQGIPDTAAADQTAKVSVSVLPVPTDELKGRIIGKEGRNIRALQQATGIDLIVDDTPEAVIISGFDPVRREVARVALNKLIVDGRIHPARIEEIVAKSRQEVLQRVKEEGEAAVLEVGLQGLHPEVVRHLGILRFRTSYGQQVLNHSKEVAYLAAMMAAEIGADVRIAKLSGLLHDIGQAIDHEVEGSHAVIGADLLQRHAVPAPVVHAVRAHHYDEEPHTIEALLLIAADAISAARPGARRESLEAYVKRLEKLEEIANSFQGVQQSYAIQAGREVRILVKPEQIDDTAAQLMARDIAKRIESELSFPGQIRVTVVRETRAVEYSK